jgi:L-histidine N-alpha-methyltransferase
MAFAEDVRAGLTATPKRLLPKYFYDDLGSALFEAICSLPEYYLTRAEAEILRERSGRSRAPTVAAVLPYRYFERRAGRERSRAQP